MILKSNKEELIMLYDNAYVAFKSCIANENNQFLKDELSVSIDSIIVKRHFISIQFNEIDIDNYTIETRLTLNTDTGEELGYYSTIVNSNFEQIDDYLVFD